MSRELICSWLKLPPDCWPTDHYTLVGLPRGESDPARIERHVHERHEWLLRYQVAHPEVVTEALNRLAQAFICLTDPAAKQAYDATLLGRAPAPAKSVKTQIPPPEPLPPPKPPADPLAWLYGPLARGKDGGSTPAPAAEAPPPAPPVPPPVNGPGPPAPAEAPPAPVERKPPAPEPVSEPVDPVVEAARSSASARRGLGTKRALYHRISRTRQLVRAWVQIGNYVGDAGRPLNKRAEAVDLVRQLTIIRQVLQGFPPILGQAGQPGYLVIALARQPQILQTFLGLMASQREALVRDWQAGLALLAAHRLFLREELWGMRRKGRLGRTARAVRALLEEHPGVWLFLLAIVSLNLVYAPLLAVWPLQIGALAALLLTYVIIRNVAARRSWLRRTRRDRQR